MNYTDIKTFADLANFVSEQTFHLFGFGVEIVLFILLFDRLKDRFIFPVATFFSLVLLFPLTISFTLLGFMEQGSSFVHLILIGLTAIWAYFKKKESYI